MKFFAIVLICLGLIGSALGSGDSLPVAPPVASQVVTVAKQADTLTDRGLFLASQIILLTGCVLAIREVLKRLDQKDQLLLDANNKFNTYIETRAEEMQASLDQSNALSLKTNELLDDLKDQLKK